MPPAMDAGHLSQEIACATEFRSLLPSGSRRVQSNLVVWEGDRDTAVWVKPRGRASLGGFSGFEELGASPPGSAPRSPQTATPPAGSAGREVGLRYVFRGVAVAGPDAEGLAVLGQGFFGAAAAVEFNAQLVVRHEVVARHGHGVFEEGRPIAASPTWLWKPGWRPRAAPPHHRTGAAFPLPGRIGRVMAPAALAESAAKMPPLRQTAPTSKPARRRCRGDRPTFPQWREPAR